MKQNFLLITEEFKSQDSHKIFKEEEPCGDRPYDTLISIYSQTRRSPTLVNADAVLINRRREKPNENYKLMHKIEMRKT